MNDESDLPLWQAMLYGFLSALVYALLFSFLIWSVTAGAAEPLCVTKADIETNLRAVHHNPVLWFEADDPVAVQTALAYLAFVKADEIQGYLLRDKAYVRILTAAYVNGCAIKADGSQAQAWPDVEFTSLSVGRARELHEAMRQVIERGTEI